MSISPEQLQPEKYDPEVFTREENYTSTKRSLFIEKGGRITTGSLFVKGELSDRSQFSFPVAEDENPPKTRKHHESAEL